MRFPLVLLFVAPIVSGWSEEGHQIITNAVVRLISDQTVRYLENHLGDDLVKASVWADSEDASSRYPDSSDYHFSHTPYRDCQPFDINRDCGFPGKEGLCIVTGLADAIEIATDPNVSRQDRVDSLKFVLHFMGDIHQPLHTGFRKDFGGNAISVGNMPNKTLHQLWDFDLVRRRSGPSGADALTEVILRSVNSNSGAFIKRVRDQVDVLAIIAKGVTDDIVGYTASIATDTTMTSTCKLAYMKNATHYIENDDAISEDYLDQRAVSVQILLSKAAVRLSILLDAMASVYASRRAEQREVARERRIQRLFEERERAAAILANKVPNPLEGNTYAVLAMEFDPVKLQWVMLPDEVDESEVGATAEKVSAEPRSAPVVRKKKKDRSTDEKLLDSIIAARTRSTFEGVDLSDIVLILRHGLNIVTSSRVARVHEYNPVSVVSFRAKFTGNSNGQDMLMFYFDTAVFPRNMSSELAVRSILRIRGVPVDGSSDLGSVWTDRGSGVASIEREFHRPPEAAGKRVMEGGETGYGAKARSETEAQASDLLARRSAAYLRLLAHQRSEVIDREFRAFQAKRRKSFDEFWVSKIDKLDGSDIVSFRRGRVMMIALTSTLSNPMNATRIRFNSFDILSADKGATPGLHNVLLMDPNICDCHLSGPIEAAVSKAIRRQSKPKVVVVNRPTVMDELSDLDSALTGSDPSRLEKLKVVQYIMITHTKPVDGWGHPSYRIIEWATKAAPDSVFDPPIDFEL